VGLYPVLNAVSFHNHGGMTNAAQTQQAIRNRAKAKLSVIKADKEDYRVRPFFKAGLERCYPLVSTEQF
jgi:hypothetical protein